MVKADYLWHKGNDLYLVRPEGSHLCKPAESGPANYRIPAPNTVDRLTQVLTKNGLEYATRHEALPHPFYSPVPARLQFVSVVAEALSLEQSIGNWLDSFLAEKISYSYCFSIFPESWENGIANDGHWGSCSNKILEAK